MTSIGLTTASHSRQTHDINNCGVQPRQSCLSFPSHSHFLEESTELDRLQYTL